MGILQLWNHSPWSHKIMQKQINTYTYDVWWDGENCLLPSDAPSVHKLVLALKSKIATALDAAFPAKKSGFSRWVIPISQSKLSQDTQTALSNLNIMISHVPKKKSNAADQHIVLGLSACHADACVLISGDSDFANHLAAVKDRGIFTLWILGPSTDAYSHLVASQTFHYEAVAKQAGVHVSYKKQANPPKVEGVHPKPSPKKEKEGSIKQIEEKKRERGEKERGEKGEKERGEKGEKQKGEKGEKKEKGETRERKEKGETGERKEKGETGEKKKEKEGKEEKEEMNRRRLWIESPAHANVNQKTLQKQLEKKYQETFKVFFCVEKPSRLPYFFAFFEREESFRQAVRDGTFDYAGTPLKMLDYSKDGKKQWKEKKQERKEKEEKKGEKEEKEEKKQEKKVEKKENHPKEKKEQKDQEKKEKKEQKEKKEKKEQKEKKEGKKAEKKAEKKEEGKKMDDPAECVCWDCNQRYINHEALMFHHNLIHV
ncbi:hypothetical protein PROFUN_08122 [Planoprotostelium fungivorum]|uniref:C2H2-type domain-containing protein n=1 Tax=Planoprotostelium fungivorum TaxID=1890364 RepID=A0A2P6MQE2_9EUKA|nr:hypothetical protein PROFUN_08122 [Planoprotostelium fungivorum]